MTKFLGNWEVESDILLPEDKPFVRFEHPAGLYTVFLRNIPELREEQGYLTMQVIFDAPALVEAKDIGIALAKQFLDYLCLVSNMKVRLRSLLQIFDWSADAPPMRNALYFSRATASGDAPYEILSNELLQTIALIQRQEPTPRLRRAIKWFGNGVSARYLDDQFTYFWFVIELVAQVAKQQAPVPDKCPVCKTPLYCQQCDASHLHRPYPKQAIEQLFIKYVKGDSAKIYGNAIAARNALLHGEEVTDIEQSLGLEFSHLVDDVGQFAWVALVNQFLPSLAGTNPLFLQTNQYVRMNLTGSAHFNFGMTPNFDDPDPMHFPKVEMSVRREKRQDPESES